MTLDELRLNWRDYAIELWIDGDHIELRDLFVLCVKYEDGLLFDTGGEQSAPAYLLKPGNDDMCYSKNQETGEWRVVGKFIKLPNA